MIIIRPLIDTLSFREMKLLYRIMIWVYKILNSKYDSDFPWLQVDQNDSITRGNHFKLEEIPVPYQNESKRHIIYTMISK